MEKIYIHLLSDFDTVFKFIEYDETIISVNTLESLNKLIDLEINNLSKNFQIDTYPVIRKEKDKNLFSYSAKFTYNSNELISKNDYVQVYKLPENHFLIKFLPFSLKKQEIEGDKLEINASEIKKLSFLDDLAGRAKVEVFKVEDKKIAKENEYFVYINDNVEKETNTDLILLAFFEAYMANDFNVCFSYLSESYGANLNKEGLQEFFGSISSCLLVNFYDYPSVLLLYKDHACVYSAKIREGKIFDIYELN
jgi:hypothetical protein